ncbi:fumarylacetoacetate hydrolase family protein [Actinoplanes derwentensis]|uniref:2-dehydro-3-deoxy-D-arabinonate dehydratase n=1 Tax=Actinoplanes derwentensis TaxID=113562 RepID=A0A1H1U456_9ACTN|nr:fumarylacetoacetate hydrolase family protein [Actinoplanes derwentensis]GID85191.1 2-hydroxyhepta-2,4-diene-1,7-dioate isomerase [Actinoplanes derwentensis]SDS67290.1 2-dehydro-3-deoxy-D-arabinonate dehydratase [Actinoplanes derwentensis]
MPICLHHLRDGDGSRWAVCQDGAWAQFGGTLADLLAWPLDRARAAIEDAARRPGSSLSGPFLPPIDKQEVWAAGVTYRRSRDGRKEESGHGALYDHVYTGDRPELFFKSSPWRVVGHRDAVGIRADSGWNVPEAEVGLVLNAAGEVFGYTLGNDMSSRSIEGENPLYLPQAKIYDRSCALGPAIVPSWTVGPEPIEIGLRVLRAGNAAYAARSSTAAMARGFEDLAGWLFRALSFPAGVVLLTGTGMVPDAAFTVRPGDTVEISSPVLGTLINPVVAVGAAPS